MAKAKITTSKGTKILIEGEPAEISQILTAIKSEESFSARNEVTHSVGLRKRTIQQKNNTATDIVISLRETGYFDKPKTLLDIKNALEEQGMIYPMTTLSGVLLKQVRKRTLGRIKQNKKWSYVKR
jgi:hypothetical protein